MVALSWGLGFDSHSPNITFSPCFNHFNHFLRNFKPEYLLRMEEFFHEPSVTGKLLMSSFSMYACISPKAWVLYICMRAFWWTISLKYASTVLSLIDILQTISSELGGNFCCHFSFTSGHCHSGIKLCSSVFNPSSSNLQTLSPFGGHFKLPLWAFKICQAGILPLCWWDIHPFPSTIISLLCLWTCKPGLRAFFDLKLQ